MDVYAQKMKHEVKDGEMKHMRDLYRRIIDNGIADGNQKK